MFSKACEYGIRALTVIAKEGEMGQRMGIKEVCKAAKTPESFTAKILQNLVKQGILNSQKGPSGGFYMTKSLCDITLYEIVVAIDGSEVFYKCGLGLPECDANQPCPLHSKFEIVRDELNNMCRNSTLESLVIELESNVYDM